MLRVDTGCQCGQGVLERLTSQHAHVLHRCIVELVSSHPFEQAAHHNEIIIAIDASQHDVRSFFEEWDFFWGPEKNHY